MGDEAKIRVMVRRIVYRTLGMEAENSKRPLLTEQTIRQLPYGNPYVIPEHALITPLARQVAMDRHIALVHEADQSGEVELRQSQGRTYANADIAGVKVVAQILFWPCLDRNRPRIAINFYC